MRQFKIGEIITLPYGTKVLANIDKNQYRGVVVGKSTTDINQKHIIRCTDGQLPNSDYAYDTFIAPVFLITVL